MATPTGVSTAASVSALAATDSSLSPTFLIDHILNRYALGAISRCRLHSRGLNDTYKVESQLGDTYYLRVFRAGWRTRAAIQAEIEVLLHLGQQVRVSTPAARADGQFLTPLDCLEGRQWAVLFTAAPGKELTRRSYTSEHAMLYGEAAAVVHCAADSFMGSRNRTPLDLEYLLERPLHLVTAEIVHRPEDVAYIERLGDRLRNCIHGMSGLEIGFCHGDFHGANACEAEGSFTFFDFDCCGWGYRAYDVAVFPWAFAIDESTTERIQAMGRSFLAGYLRHRKLGDIDLDAIPAFVAIRQLWLMGLHVGLGDRFGWGWINDGYFDRQLKVLRDWEKNYLDQSGAELLRPPIGQ